MFSKFQQKWFWINFNVILGPLSDPK
jgi:hypothetical protein